MYCSRSRNPNTKFRLFIKLKIFFPKTIKNTRIVITTDKNIERAIKTEIAESSSCFMYLFSGLSASAFL